MSTQNVIYAALVRENIRSHFQELVASAGGNIELVDTELHILADLSANSDMENHELMDYRIYDAEGDLISYCEAQHVEKVSLDFYVEQGIEPRYTGSVELEELVGMDLSSFLEEAVVA